MGPWGRLPGFEKDQSGHAHKMHVCAFAVAGRHGREKATAWPARGLPVNLMNLSQFWLGRRWSVVALVGVRTRKPIRHFGFCLWGNTGVWVPKPACAKPCWASWLALPAHRLNTRQLSIPSVQGVQGRVRRDSSQGPLGEAIRPSKPPLQPPAHPSAPLCTASARRGAL